MEIFIMRLLSEVAESVLSMGGNLTFHHFSHWSPGITSAFRRVESRAFRRELRYQRREMRERGREPGFEGLIIYDSGKAAAVMLVRQGSSSECLYLDTLAVGNPGRKLGTRLLRALLDEAEATGYRQVELDTELASDHEHDLVLFYERFGFKVLSVDESIGNVSMVRQFHNDTPGKYRRLNTAECGVDYFSPVKTDSPPHFRYH
jgi:GNAT superfamily N-acetyltransferase